MTDCDCTELTGEARHDCPSCGGEGVCRRGAEPPAEVQMTRGSSLTREELLELLDASEERERAHVERWEELRAKVEGTTESVRLRALGVQADLLEVVSGLSELRDIDSHGQQEATSKALLRTDDARRAYAIFDALRSVGIWMRGYA